MISTAQWFEILKPLFEMMLGLFVFMTIVILIKSGIKKFINNRKFKFQNQWLTERQILDYLKGLKPSEFEDYIAYTFKNLGYSTFSVGGSNDGGIDVIAEKDGNKSLIQCKRYNKNKVTLHDVRDFYGALAHDLANAKGLFVTTNIFTKEAEKFAEGKPIELIDGFKLIKLIKIAENKTDINDIESSDNLCPKCGGALIIKEGKYGKFYGCSNFPNCRFSKGTK